MLQLHKPGSRGLADRRLQERLQPSLLDRLTDDDPGSGKEVRDERAIDTRRLKEILQRDLSWLLNTSNMGNALDAERYPWAARSVLNYGVDVVEGSFASEDRAVLIKEAIERAIIHFEPRISKQNLRVVLRSEENARETIISFDIRADMWAKPIPQNLYLRSEVDLITGALELTSTG